MGGRQRDVRLVTVPPGRYLTWGKRRQGPEQRGAGIRIGSRVTAGTDRARGAVRSAELSTDLAGLDGVAKGP